PRGKLVRGAFGDDVLHHWNDGAACGLDLLYQCVQQLLSPRHADDAHALEREPPGDGATDPDAGSRYHCRPGLKLEIHVRSFRSQEDWPFTRRFALRGPRGVRSPSMTARHIARRK